MMPKIGVIVQVRMSSTRLPKKSMMKIEGKSLIWHVIERLKRCKTIQRVILATSVDKTDDPLEVFAKENGLDIYRGNLADVLDRYYQAAKKYQLNVIVRVTGDCPLVDPKIVDDAVKLFLDNRYDYVSNGKPPLADGFDVEVFSSEALEQAWKNASLASEREHVTPYIRKNAKNVHFIANDPRLGELHCSVDRIEDLEFVREIYRHLIEGGKDHSFGYADVLGLLEEHPELKEINRESVVNEGYQKSLKEDKKVR